MEKCLTGCDEKKGNVYTVSTHVAGQKSQWGVRPSKVRFQTKSFSLSLSLLSLKRTRARARKNTHMLIFIRLYQHCRFFMYISLLFSLFLTFLKWSNMAKYISCQVWRFFFHDLRNRFQDTQKLMQWHYTEILQIPLLVPYLLHLLFKFDSLHWAARSDLVTFPTASRPTLAVCVCEREIIWDIVRVVVAYFMQINFVERLSRTTQWKVVVGTHD